MESRDANDKQDQEILQQVVLNQFPFPVAVNYRRLLDATSWESRVLKGINVFETLLRSLCLVAVSQYVIQDHKQLADEQLDQFLLKTMPRQSIGGLTEILFRILKIYDSQDKEILFIKELGSLLDKKDAKKVFIKIVEVRNDLFHRFIPADDNGWRTKFEEIHTELLFIFSLFEFLKNYNFIRVVHRTGKQYTFEKYKGQQVTTTTDQLPSKNDDIQEGWFYLQKCKGTGKLLHLYPYIIAYEHDADVNTPGLQMDAGLLDTFTHTQIRYLAMVLQEIISREDQELLAYFNTSFYRPLEGEQIRTHVLSWDLLRKLGKEISQNHMGDALEKYSPDLYLERKKVQEVFNDFLKSEKTCLVLSGKSGVGKTNFLIATANLLEIEDNFCVTLYNGGRLPSDRSIIESSSRGIE